MRLDHLLSKEHIAACERMSRTVAHGWNVDYSAHGILVGSLVLRFGAWNAVTSGGCVLGTLLGPEGTGCVSSLNLLVVV